MDSIQSRFNAFSKNQFVRLISHPKMIIFNGHWTWTWNDFWLQYRTKQRWTQKTCCNVNGSMTRIVSPDILKLNIIPELSSVALSLSLSSSCTHAHTPQNAAISQYSSQTMMAETTTATNSKLYFRYAFCHRRLTKVETLRNEHFYSNSTTQPLSPPAKIKFKETRKK